MCNHIWKVVNDVRVCLRCGLTVRRSNNAIVGFDRKLPNYLQEKGKETK